MPFEMPENGVLTVEWIIDAQVIINSDICMLPK